MSHLMRVQKKISHETTDKVQYPTLTTAYPTCYLLNCVNVAFFAL